MKWKIILTAVLTASMQCGTSFARYYDPGAGRFLSADSLVADGKSPQTLNRYSYVLNKPTSLTDPSGHFAVLAIALGAAIGAYQGYEIAKGKGYNLSDWQTYAYVQAGGGLGVAAGAIGSGLASASIPMANTLGLMGASASYSTGISTLAGGSTQTQVGYGFGSYNFANGRNDHLLDGDNAWFVDAAYAFGALANIQDVVALNHGQSYDVNSASTKNGHHKWGHSSITRDGTTMVSVGPPNGAAQNPFLNVEGTNSWKNYSGADGTWTVRLNNVNSKIMNQTRFNMVVKSEVQKTLQWNLAKNSCVGHASRALSRAGVPTLPINIHPHVLNAQLTLRQAGIYSNPYASSR